MTAPRYINWNESFSVGHAAMDSQHRRIIEIINDLFQAIQQHEVPGGGITEIVNRLMTYSHTHLVNEERLLASVKYPGLKDHVALHGQYVDRTKKFAADLRAGRPIDTRELLEFLKTWWTEHIRGADGRYRPYVA